MATLDAPARPSGAIPFALDVIDTRLADGGLAVGALHEMTPAAPALAEDAATTLFISGAAARAGPGPVLWVLTKFDLYAPGVEQAGLGPDRLMFAQARDDRELLAVMEDALRHGGLAAVVGEVRRADMTATRRLQLAASDGRTPALLMRRWRKLGTSPLNEPSAATTRWRIACASSVPLGVPGVGRACWSVELVRQRNGNPFSLIVEGCDAQGRLGLPATAADRAAAAGHRAQAA
ncbi:protein ImuA [Sphingomonas panacisoli]|uniref:Protein ImuA n=1 Tax=Sphingomonas panacisoli TaxID=1813879 RepID=A0A5B8LLS1_9SPHN|nr:protein ImuA [Sphingomonas panacisoli]